MFYTVTPQPNELLSSWLIRCAILHGIDPIRFTDGIWDMERVWTRDIDRYLSKDKSIQLQKLTSLSYNQIQDMTLAPTYQFLMKKASIDTKKHWQHIIPTGIRNRTKTNGLHFCPQCLNEPIPYFKKQWRLSWNCICEKHKTLLSLHCPKCHQCFSPHLVDYLHTDFRKCQNCDYALTSIPTINIKKSVLSLQFFLNASLHKKQVLNHSYPLIDITVPELFTSIRGLMLFFRDLTHGNTYCSFRTNLFDQIGYNYKKILSGTDEKRLSVDALPVLRRYQLLEIITLLFQYSLPNIIQMFAQADISQQLFSRSFSNYSPTLLHISKSLKDRSKVLRKKVSPSISVPKASTKEEVESLMEEIRPYL